MEFGLDHLMGDELAAHVEESRAFYTSAQRQQRPDLTSVEGLRQARAAIAARPEAVEARTEVRTVEAEGRRVAVRITPPVRGTSRAVVLDLPGGGFFLGLAARGDTRNAQLADALGATVVSVDYRLAPEDPWPAAPDDCEAAALWVLARGEEEFGARPVLIGGASAGANLALATFLRLRSRGSGDRIAGIVLQYGAYDLSARTPGGRLYAEEYFIQAYVGHVADRTNPDISPLFGDLGGMPPTLVVVGALDTLLEDNLAMAARLSAAGGAVDLRVFPESPHGFTSHPTPMADAAWRAIASWAEDTLSRD